LYIIVEKRPLSETAMLMSIHAPQAAEKALAGQFVLIRPQAESRPTVLMIAETDRRAGEITVIFHCTGPAAKMLAAREVGDALAGFSGPFGQESRPPTAEKVIAVCGGMGCAALYPKIKGLYAAGARVDVIAGFRSRGSVLLEDQLRAHCTSLTLSTEDGSCGRQGSASLLLHERLQRESYQLAIAAGPVGLLQAVCTLTKKLDLPTTVTLHPAVTDEEGRCSCCRIAVDRQIKCACTDGLDFNGNGIDWSAQAETAATNFCPLLEKRN
jgi:ferredoxin--NADP+ reductase